MKISCPHCSQKYDIAPEDVGADLECVKCNQTFQLTAGAQSQNLTECPDCNREISRRAESCPHCGAPLKKAKPATPAPPPVTTNGIHRAVFAGVVSGGVAILFILFIIWGTYTTGKEKEEEQRARLQCLSDMQRAFQSIKDDLALTDDQKALYVGPEAMLKLLKIRSDERCQWVILIPSDWEKINELNMDSIGEIPLLFCKEHNNVFFQDGHGSGYSEPQSTEDVIARAKIPESIKAGLAFK